MTHEQAIIRLRTLIKKVQFRYANDDIDALLLAIKSLRRLTPCKPTLSDSGDYGICPNFRCRRLVLQYEPTHGDIEIPHCKWCGQALNWGGSDKT